MESSASASRRKRAPAGAATHARAERRPRAVAISVVTIRRRRACEARPASCRVVDSACKEIADRCRDLLRMGLEREVARVEEMDHRTGIVTSECLRTPRQEEWIVFAPYRQQAWLVRPEVTLECRVERDVALVVAEQVQLD